MIDRLFIDYMINLIVAPNIDCQCLDCLNEAILTRTLNMILAGNKDDHVVTLVNPTFNI